MTPSLTKILNKITELKIKWDSLNPLPVSTLQTLRKDWEVTHTYHSNAIEGNTLTLNETKAILLDGVTISGKTLREHLEVVNHREAMHFITRLASSNIPLKEVEILELHRYILTGIQSEAAGYYRNMRVRVAGAKRVFPNPLKVPELMSKLVKDINTFEGHNVLQASLAHYKLVAIHPFIDGNGRTARLLMNLLLSRQQYPPVLLPVEKRSEYYDALSVADEGNIALFNELIARSVLESLIDCLNSI